MEINGYFDPTCKPHIVEGTTRVTWIKIIGVKNYRLREHDEKTHLGGSHTGRHANF